MLCRSLVLPIVRIKSRVLYSCVVAACHVHADPVEGDGRGGRDGGEPMLDDVANVYRLKSIKTKCNTSRTVKLIE